MSQGNGKREKTDIKRKVTTEIKEHGFRDLFIGLGVLYAAGIMAQGARAFFCIPEIVSGAIDKSEVFTLNPITSVWTAISTVSGILCLLLTIAIVWVGWFYGIKPRMKEETGYKDDRNFRIAEEGTYGTSSLMREDEIEEVLDLKPIGEQEGNILGKYKNKVISIPSKREFEEKAKKNNWGIEEIINNKFNNNIVAIGAPGTMKTRAFVRNIIMQAAKREESMIITDPKGELVEDTAVYLENNGYKVRIFNLVNLLSSDSWNCIATIGTDSIVAKIFADTIANNAGAGNDRYWVDNASIIFKAVSLYVIESPTEVNKTMGRVYDILSSYDLPTLDGLFYNLPENSVARRAYNSFKRCNDNVKGQILNGISTMLSVFQDDTVRDITNHDEIDLEEICYEKCAYFLIMSDQHSSFDFLAVLFYAMSFVKQVEAIDRERSKKEAGVEFRKTRPINYIMDEFSNLGQIPNFAKRISTVRSRDINITIIIQNIPQLKNRYPDDQWQEILGCCDIMVCLGCTDEMTAKYISTRTGIATIEVESVNSTYDRQIVLLNQETEYKEVKSRGQRQVMTLDEVLRMKNLEELVFIRGQKPLLCEKFDYTLNPESKKFVKCSVTDHKPQWRLEQEAKRAENEAKVAVIRAKAEEKSQIEIKRVEKNAQANKYSRNLVSGEQSNAHATSGASAASGPSTTESAKPASSVQTSKGQEKPKVVAKSPEKSERSKQMEHMVNNVLSWDDLETDASKSKEQNSDAPGSSDASPVLSTAVATATSDEEDLMDIAERDVEIPRAHDDEDDDDDDDENAA